MNWRNMSGYRVPIVASAERMWVQRFSAKVSFAIVLALPFIAAPADAQDADTIETLDVTMQLLPEGATLPDAVTRVELPPAARASAADSAASELDTANAARSGDNPGREVAAEARERGREHAQEVRENVGRGRPDAAGPPDGAPGAPRGGGPPEALPTPPGPPDDISPPGRGGGPPSTPGN
jgi:hypothetical protein